MFGQVMIRCTHDEILKELLVHMKSRHSKYWSLLLPVVIIHSNFIIIGMVPVYNDVDKFISKSILLLKAFPKRAKYYNNASYCDSICMSAVAQV